MQALLDDVWVVQQPHRRRSTEAEVTRVVGTAGDDVVFHLLDPAQGADSNLEPIRIPLADAVSASTHGSSEPTKGATP